LIDRPHVSGPDTVFFLSDYGLDDEFVGVVHAVIARQAPGARVIDLSHGVAPFDVGAGAAMLERAVDHLGPGVVLAVVDPGVAGPRRSVALEARRRDGPRFFVGPDNGLLPSAIERRGGLAHAVELDRGASPGTFDGRDVLAPAAAALCAGRPLHSLGPSVAAASLTRLPRPRVFEAVSPGRGSMVSEVTWVDRFGNVQLAALAGHLPRGLDVDTVRVVNSRTGAALTDPRPVRRVGAYGELARDELGLLVDANGHLAVVAKEGSAAERLAVARGSDIELAGPTDEPFPPHPHRYDPR
jgi:S-adenosyl-L-methionine hydrolase (adenosine-forming)